MERVIRQKLLYTDAAVQLVLMLGKSIFNTFIISWLIKARY